jgi:hypothetical protein
MLSITEEMEKALEKERNKRKAGTIPETTRVTLSEAQSVQKIEHKT